MLFILPCLLFFLFKTPVAVKALEEFNIDQTINYQIDSRGHATVKQTLNIKNNLSQIYPKQYHLKLSQPDIDQIKAYDQEGEIVLEIKEEGDTTLIDLTLNNPQVGQGKENQFTLEYRVEQFAKTKGQIWEITTPKFNDLQKLNSLDLKISIPLAFGDIAYASKRPFKNSQSSLTHRQIIYNKNQLADKILLAFGQYQLFDFKLKYYLKNQNPEKETQEIPIPPGTSRQAITIKTLSPQPENIIIDPDGNWLAQYNLEPNRVLDIILEGQAEISHFSIPASNPIDIHTYTSPSEFWPAQDPSIKSISQNLNSPRKIYDYVINTLEYDYQNIRANRRQGAVSALLNPQHALCTEFTDLFVTLSRAAGIPAREVQGFAHTNNPKIKPVNQNNDILHAWPEYYNQEKKEWTPIDPTWGKTTGGIDYFSELDLNHLSFVFHGLDSQKPQSPGFYKSPSDQKTIQVNFAKEKLTATSEKPQLELKEKGKNLVLLVKNPNNIAIHNLRLESAKLSLNQKINTLPPFSYQEINLEPKPVSHILNQAYTVKLNQATHLLKNPHRQNIFLPLGFITAILLVTAVFFYIKKK